MPECGWCQKAAGGGHQKKARLAEALEVEQKGRFKCLAARCEAVVVIGLPEYGMYRKRAGKGHQREASVALGLPEGVMCRGGRFETVWLEHVNLTRQRTKARGSVFSREGVAGKWRQGSLGQTRVGGTR